MKVFKIGIMCQCGHGQLEFTGSIINREIGTTEYNTKYLVQPLGKGKRQWVTKRSLGFLDYKWENPEFKNFENKMEEIEIIKLNNGKKA